MLIIISLCKHVGVAIKVVSKQDFLASSAKKLCDKKIFEKSHHEPLKQP